MLAFNGLFYYGFCYFWKMRNFFLFCDAIWILNTLKDAELAALYTILWYLNAFLETIIRAMEFWQEGSNTGYCWLLSLICANLGHGRITQQANWPYLKKSSFSTSFFLVYRILDPWISYQRKKNTYMRKEHFIYHRRKKKKAKKNFYTMTIQAPFSLNRYQSIYNRNHHNQE